MQRHQIFRGEQEGKRQEYKDSRVHEEVQSKTKSWTNGTSTADDRKKKKRGKSLETDETKTSQGQGHVRLQSKGKKAYEKSKRQTCNCVGQSFNTETII